jgi:hypothetical protein
VRKLLIVLAVLAVVAVVVDRVAEHVAEGEVATVVKDREGLPSEPDVEFHGFPFLTQVLANDLSKVTMTLPEVEPRVGDTEQIRVEDVKVTFENVRTSDSFHRATAERMTGSAMIPYDSISDLGPYTAEYGGEGAEGVGLVKLTPDDDQGLPFDLSFTVGVTATSNGGFAFVGKDGTTRLALIPRALRPILGSLIQVPHQLYGLPAEFAIKSLSATPDGIRLALAGHGVELTR